MPQVEKERRPNSQRAWAGAQKIFLVSILLLFALTAFVVFGMMYWVHRKSGASDYLILSAMATVNMALLRFVALLIGIAVASGGLLMSFITIDSAINMAANVGSGGGRATVAAVGGAVAAQVDPPVADQAASPDEITKPRNAPDTDSMQESQAASHQGLWPTLKGAMSTTSPGSLGLVMGSLIVIVTLLNGPKIPINQPDNSVDEAGTQRPATVLAEKLPELPRSTPEQNSSKRNNETKPNALMCAEKPMLEGCPKPLTP